jgi:hypothetical protein
VVVVHEPMGEHHNVAYLQQMLRHVHLKSSEKGGKEVAHQLAKFDGGLSVVLVGAELDNQCVAQYSVLPNQSLVSCLQSGQHFGVKVILNSIVVLSWHITDNPEKY